MDTPHACPNNGCFWHAMSQLGEYGLWKRPHDLFELPFDGFHWIGHGGHPICWSSAKEDTHVAREYQLQNCLQRACPGFVQLFRGHPVPAIHAAEAQWIDFFAMSKAISSSRASENLHLDADAFYPRLTPAALVPYEQIFHVRMRSDTHKEAAPVADMFLAYQAGTLPDVRHLALDVTRTDLALCINRERALYYKTKYRPEWEQIAGARGKIKAPETEGFLWQRKDTLLNLAMRAVLQHWARWSEADRVRMNQMFNSWSVMEPVRKRAKRH